MFLQTLVEFLFRLTFGVAAAMGVTPSREVTSGFFRIHLWVLLGVQTLAALAIYSARPNGALADSDSSHMTVWKGQLVVSCAGAFLSYCGASIWMYETKLLGKIAVWIVATLALLGCTLPLTLLNDRNFAFQLADRITSGALLGLVATSMLLGHWYLNTPTMKLAPLQRLIALLAVALVLRAIVCGVGLGLELSLPGAVPAGQRTTWLIFVSLRWLAGLVSVAGLAWLTRQTLKIPNT
ncbi:MAG TPA: hypothetical protein VFV87_04200, partial [Pirellulaceae bacterium]|nr:hypothetical protein [Pirellulaceae bacterium]